MVTHQGYWDSLAGTYDGLFADRYSAFEDGFLEREIHGLGTCDGARVLELGCGTGLGYRMIRRWGDAEYVGVDASARMLSLARRSHPEADLRIGRIEDLAADLGTFDYVIAINAVCSYVDDFDRLLLALSKITHPGTTVFLSFLNSRSLRRLIRFRSGPVEPLQTRGGPKCTNGEKQYVYSQAELEGLFGGAGYTAITTKSYGLFAGVFKNFATAQLEKKYPSLGRKFGHITLLRGTA